MHVHSFKRKHFLEIPFRIPRDEIFASEEQEKEINLKKHHALYRRLQEVTIPKSDRSYDPPVNTSLQCGIQRLCWPRF